MHFYIQADKFCLNYFFILFLRVSHQKGCNIYWFVLSVVLLK